MINFPLSFSGTAEALSPMRSDWISEAQGLKVYCAVPPEFEGVGGSLSPEDLYLFALQNCFIGTFKVYALHSKFSFEKLEMKSELVVDKNELGKPCMKSLLMTAIFSGVSDPKKCELLAKKVMENGFILQSVKTQVHLEVQYA
jgi:organic hydroperoxide reductase OsmC/OhrA